MAKCVDMDQTPHSGLGLNCLLSCLVGLEFNGPVYTSKVMSSGVSLPNHTFTGKSLVL